MSDPLPPAEAKRRFTLYLLVKFAGLGLMAAGLALAHARGVNLLVAFLIAGGAASLFIRPRMLGLTGPRR
jgi:hypothetical protein